jgi:histidinol dehydrogenase
MKKIVYPEREIWESICKRPVFEQEELTQTVLKILENVKINGDSAIAEYSQLYDAIELQDFEVSEKEIDESDLSISEELKEAINIAKQNIEKFHQAQFSSEAIIETTKGVKCWRKNIGIENVGLYVPNGSAPLFSTLLMLGIPAKIAKCKQIILCTPCNKDHKINPAILYTAKLVGIDKIYKIGGAQAISAMAFGTETIAKVNKIFGPGNQYVTKAKELVQQNGTSIDMPAGPSEVLVIADTTCNPEFVAADLLSQAEHGVDSQVVLLSNNDSVIEQINSAIAKQLEDLPRKKIAAIALKNSFSVVLNSIAECIDFSNCYAPEHLILALADANNLSDKIINAGSVFIGNFSCESAGDYASGTNHTLPTNGYAKSYSGVSLDSFLKKITFQEISPEGLKNIGPSVEIMAEAEGLLAHKNSVTIRLKTINND